MAITTLVFGFLQPAASVPVMNKSGLFLYTFKADSGTVPASPQPKRH
jgi:hypothetical protein